MIELNVWIVYDGEGNYEAHCAGPDEAMERYDEEIGGHEVRRCVKVCLHAPAPVVTEFSGEVPEEAKEGTLTVS